MMEREFVDLFFLTGKLKISSFVDFRKHIDEERKDDEGKNIICLRGDNSTAFAVTVHGRNEYILCGSSIKDKELMSAFSANAAIQIFNTTEFANVIARHIPGVVKGFEGFCYYLDGAVEFPPHNLGPIPQITSQLKLLNQEFSGYVFEYSDFVNEIISRMKTKPYKQFLTTMPGWDNQARQPGKGMAFHQSSPEEFGKWLKNSNLFTILKQDLKVNNF